MNSIVMKSNMPANGLYLVVVVAINLYRIKY